MIRGYHGTTRSVGRSAQRVGLQAGTCFTVDDDDMRKKRRRRQRRNPVLDLSAFELARRWLDGTVVEVDLEKLPGFTLDWVLEDEGDGGSSWEARVPIRIEPDVITVHFKASVSGEKP